MQLKRLLFTTLAVTAIARSANDQHDKQLKRSEGFVNVVREAAVPQASASVLDPDDVIKGLSSLIDITSNMISIAQDLASLNIVTAVPDAIQLIDNFGELVKTLTDFATGSGSSGGVVGGVVNGLEDGASGVISGIGGLANSLTGGLFGGGASKGSSGSEGSSPGSSSVAAGNTDGGDGSKQQPFPDDKQAQICELIKKFVALEQQFLDFFISKADIFAKIPVIGNVIIDTLTKLQGAFNKAFANIFEAVPSCAAEAKKEMEQLNAKLTDAISAYTFKYTYTYSLVQPTQTPGPA